MLNRHRWMFVFTILLTTCWLSVAHSSDKPTTVYTGMLGKQPVVFDFMGHSETSGPSYFYAHHHRTLELDGKFGTDHLTLREGLDGGDARPLITLDRQTDGGWRGNWQGPHGKALPITLHPAKPTPPAVNAPPYLKQLYVHNTFEYLRLTSLKPQAGKREHFMGHTLQWWRIPDADTTSFEILDGYPDAERQRINRVLMDRLWRETGAYYACIEGPGHGSNIYHETVTPRLLTSDLVSVSIFTSHDCGGAHPDFGDDPINLNASTAKPLTLEDILWVGEGKPPHYLEGDDTEPLRDSPAYEAYSSYRDNELTPWLIRQWKHLYPKQVRPAKSNYGCDYREAFAWQYIGWYMTPIGIFIIPSLDGAVRACKANDDWSVLPWRVVRKYPGPMAPKLVEKVLQRP